jgi:CheY-like chemotaxis protein
MNKVRLLLELASDSLIQQIRLKHTLAENESMRNNLKEVSFQLEGIEGSIFDEQGIQGGLLEDITNNMEQYADANNNGLDPNDASTFKNEDTIHIKEGLDEFKKHNQGYFSSLGEQVKSAKPTIERNEPLIMVADDQKMMLKIITTILKPKGFEIDTASNGAEILMKAKVKRPDVILLDIDMPILNGIDTLKAFKKLEELKSVPVIMLTSNSDKDSFLVCRELGAVDYIVKPTNADILLKKILAVL